ncbi:hypothetical protein CDAR_305921 [Caerostris darwini]|uniref:Uncharacterized protein n=1 Tax=Caerostris darwini TaxID=1538125 RepID=A0AAV4VU54_9ARAC|nr:hypothetical protein CDAR_305921 [Caerostris darwini]
MLGQDYSVRPMLTWKQANCRKEGEAGGVDVLVSLVTHLKSQQPKQIFHLRDNLTCSQTSRFSSAKMRNSNNPFQPSKPSSNQSHSSAAASTAAFISPIRRDN